MLRTMRRFIVLICTALCVAMLSGCSSGTPSTPKAFARGERVKVGQQALTVLAVTRVREALIKPSRPDHSVIAVECLVENVEDTLTVVSPMTDLRVTDVDGYRYKPITSDKRLDGGLRMGQKTRGDVIFEVPNDAKDLRLEFSPGLTGGYAVIKLVDEV